MTALVAKYVDLALILLFTGMGYYMYLKKPSSLVCKELFAYQTAIIILFNILSFVLIILREVHTAKTVEDAIESGILSEGTHFQTIRGIMLKMQQITEHFLPSWLRFSVVFTLLIYMVLLLGMYLLIHRLHRHTNRLLWNCVFMLVSIGFVMLWRLDQETARYQVYWLAAGFVVINAVMLFFHGRWIWNIPVWLFLLASVGLIVLPFIFIVNGKAWNVRTLLFIFGVLATTFFLDEVTGIITNMMVDTAYEGNIAIFKADDGTNIFRVLFYSIPAIASWVFRSHIEAEDDPLINTCVNLSVVTAGIYLFSFFTSGILIGRLPIYFSLANYILIPWLIREFFSRESALFVEGGFLALYSAFFYFQVGVTWGRL